jgi:AbrB family looped-hinge helix DNA binding protein
MELSMIKAKITKNGMINFPAEYRKKLNLQPGDEVGFLETPEGLIVVPVRDILSLTNPQELPIAKEIISEVHAEREQDRNHSEDD